MAEDEEAKKEGEGEGEDTIGEYMGNRNEAKQRHGKGKALLPNGDYYEGYYSEGLRNGQGYYVFKGGGQYRGHYKKGMKSAYGTFFYPDGSKYEGEWKKDKKHGHGVYIYPNGDVYEGMWRNDFREGLGTYIYKSCDVTIIGIWVKGKMQGPVQITYPDSTYFGTFQNNMPIGKGCFTFNSHCMLHGYYVHIKDESPNAEEEEVMLGLEEEVRSPREGYPKGISPTWRPQKITLYSEELLPPHPHEPRKPPSISSSVDLDTENIPVPEQERENESEEVINETTGDNLADSDMKKSDEKLEPEVAAKERYNEDNTDGNGTLAASPPNNEPATDLQAGGNPED